MQSLFTSTRELIAASHFARVETLLGHFLSDAPADAEAERRMRQLRLLCGDAAEHQRLAEEFLDAARAHDRALEELRPAIESALADWAGAPRREAPTRSDDHPARGPVALEAAAQATVEARVLGPLEVAVAGRPVAKWRSQKARALFQYLILHADRPVRRELLMEVFWPGYGPGSARNNLNVSVYNLRRTFQDLRAGRYVMFAAGGYVLNPRITFWVDRDAFLTLIDQADSDLGAGRNDEAIETYGCACALYRGRLFEDDTTSEWHLLEQRQLEDVYLQALEHLAEVHLGRSDPKRAERAARRALADDPCRESRIAS